MPIKWKRTENPYRVNYFTILQIGPAARRQVIPEMSRKIISALQSGKAAFIRKVHLEKPAEAAPAQPGAEQDPREFRLLEQAEVSEASSRLIEETIWAEEVLLVHPVPALDNRELQKVCAGLLEQTTPAHSGQKLRLSNPAALAALAPTLAAGDIPLPAWEEFTIPGPGTPEDQQLDIQFDA
jgi:hypothetical protein